MQKAPVQSLGQEDPLEKEMATPSRQRSLVGSSPWDRKESDMTEHTYTHQTGYAPILRT